MKKILCISLTVLICSILSGCVKVDIENNPPAKDENIQEQPVEEPTAAENDETTDVWESFDYYTYRTGSSSVSEEYAIYTYEDQVIFVADYFNCGDGVSETYALDEEQIAALQEQLEQGLTDTQEEKKESQFSAEEVPADGGSSTSASICLDGNIQEAKKLDLSALQIELQDASDIWFEPNEDDGYDIENDDELLLSVRWTTSTFYIGIYEYERMVGEQAEAILGQPVETMEIGTMGDLDYELIVTTEDGEEHTLTVTVWGYVLQ